MAELDLTKAIIQIPYTVFQQVLDERETAVDEADQIRDKVERFKNEKQALLAQVGQLTTANSALQSQLTDATTELQAFKDAAIRQSQEGGVLPEPPQQP